MPTINVGAHHQPLASYPLSVTPGGGSISDHSATPPIVAMGAQAEDTGDAAMRAGNPGSLNRQPSAAAAGPLLSRAESNEGTVETLQAALSDNGLDAEGRLLQAQDAMARPAARNEQLPSAHESGDVPPEQLDGNAATQQPSSNGHSGSLFGGHPKDWAQAPRNIVLEIDGRAAGKLCMEPAPQQAGLLLFQLAGKVSAQDAHSLVAACRRSFSRSTFNSLGGSALQGRAAFRQLLAFACLLQVNQAGVQEGISIRSSPGGPICGTASGLSCCPESFRLPRSWHLVSTSWPEERPAGSEAERGASVERQQGGLEALFKPGFCRVGPCLRWCAGASAQHQAA